MFFCTCSAKISKKAHKELPKLNGENIENFLQQLKLWFIAQIYVIDSMLKKNNLESKKLGVILSRVDVDLLNNVGLSEIKEKSPQACAQPLQCEDVVSVIGDSLDELEALDAQIRNLHDMLANKKPTILLADLDPISSGVSGALRKTQHAFRALWKVVLQGGYQHDPDIIGARGLAFHYACKVNNSWEDVSQAIFVEQISTEFVQSIASVVKIALLPNQDVEEGEAKENESQDQDQNQFRHIK